MILGVNTGHYQELPRINLQAELLRGWPVIRFMDWQQTNATTNSAPVTDYTRLPKEFHDWEYRGGVWSTWAGVPLQVCITLANKLGARGWYCIPHGLTRESRALMVKDILTRSKYRPILEYSNEVWNAGFYQQRQIAGDEEPVLWAALDAQAEATNHLVELAAYRADVVASAQAANSAIAQRLIAQVSGVKALAIAPYYRSKVEYDLVPHRLRVHRAIADGAGVELWAYECGPHDTGNEAADSASADWHVARIRPYLDTLRNGGVSLACWYNIASQHRPRHAWGLYRLDGITAHKTPVLQEVETWTTLNTSKK